MMETEYHTYSDASLRGGFAGYGFIVAQKVCGVVTVLHECFGTIEEFTNSTDAELAAMTIALQKVPDGSKGFAHTDLGAIESLLNLEIKYARKNASVVGPLVAELKRTGLVVKFMPTNTRPKLYNRCHRMARRAIKLESRNGYPKKKRVKPVRDWVIVRMSRN